MVGGSRFLEVGKVGGGEEEEAIDVQSRNQLGALVPN